MRSAIVAFALSIIFFSTSASSQTGSATTVVRMQLENGTYVVPVLINNAIKLDFVVDSGSADVSLPADVVLTLLRTGTIGNSDFIGEQTYVLADGSKLPSMRFRLRSLKVGNLFLENVVASFAPAKANLLLGQSFLGRFQSWSIDNTSHQLILNGCCKSAEVQIDSQSEAALREPLTISPGGVATANPETTLHERSRQFIFTLYRQMSSSNEQALAMLGSIYADTVNYFGSDIPRAEVIEREMKFLTRWPIRLYNPKNGNVIVNCDVSVLICSATGVLQFDARSTERNQRSIGEATFQYNLQFSSSQSTPKVILENGQVFKRTVQALSR
jgi:hypothetical protein